MSTQTEDASSQRIVGVEVLRYKNLLNVWLPWNDGLALFGVNGAGKTNLLECLALLLGTDESVRLARPRLAYPGPDELAIIARQGVQSLPWGPDSVLTRDLSEQMVANFPGLERVAADASWWRMLGGRLGETFSEGLASTTLQPDVVAFLIDLAKAPTVRYSLMSLTDGPKGLERQFSRTLMSSRLPKEVAALADQLPDLFAPLRSSLEASGWRPSGLVPVLELPPVRRGPAVLQWLPRARSSEEVNDDLARTFEAAADPTSRLVEGLAELPLRTTPNSGDWHWWLHTIGERRGSDELKLTLPGIMLRASGASDADFALVNERVNPPVELSHTGEDTVLEFFSSGERRWLDEALATVARELTRFGQRASVYAEILDGLSEETLITALQNVADTLDAVMSVDGYWSESVLDQLLQALEPAMLTAARARDEEESDPSMREVMQQIRPGLLALQPPLVIRAFDEPEAHLHPLAQRRAAAVLDRIRNQGQNVVIASHSPAFLDLPGWAQVHVERLEGRTHLENMTAEANDARSALAEQLGVNRGELLAGINGLLLVEGKHDQLVLERLFGSALRSSGIAVVRMHGTNNLLATAELDFIDQYLNVPVVVLVDYAKVDRVTAGRPASDEEEKLLQLRRSLKRRSRTYQLVGLERPDIVCYLSESALREFYPDFPGWPTVLRAFEGVRSRPSFKKWLSERFRVDLIHSGHIEGVLDRMVEQGHPPAGELTRRTNEILSHFGSDYFPEVTGVRP